MNLPSQTLSGTCASYKGIEYKNFLRVKALITGLLKNLGNSKARYPNSKIPIAITIRTLRIKGKY
jgi:hypothetical protein